MRMQTNAIFVSSSPLHRPWNSCFHRAPRQWFRLSQGPMLCCFLSCQHWLQDRKVARARPNARLCGHYIPSSSVINADDLHYMTIIMVEPLKVNALFKTTGDGDPHSYYFGLIYRLHGNVLHLYFCPEKRSVCCLVILQLLLLRK